MKRISILVSVAVLVLAFAVSAQPDKRTEEQYTLASRMSPDQQLIKLENEWADGLVRRDVAFLDSILAADYTETHPDGVVSTKPQRLAFLKSGEEGISSLVADDMRVRVYEDTAVVTGRSTVKQVFKGKDVSGQFRWTDL